MQSLVKKQIKLAAASLRKGIIESIYKPRLGRRIEDKATRVERTIQSRHFEDQANCSGGGVERTESG